MKRSPLIIGLLALAALGGSFLEQQQPDAGNRPEQVSARHSSGSADEQLRRAFEERRSDIQIEVSGTVSKRLADDNDGSRHQKFILQLDSGQTLLVAHNIDLAPRIEGLQRGDRIRVYGEYEWNSRGGVLHWTHHDPAGRHPDGWIDHQGRRYQ